MACDDARACAVAMSVLRLPCDEPREPHYNEFVLVLEGRSHLSRVSGWSWTVRQVMAAQTRSIAPPARVATELVG